MYTDNSMQNITNSVTWTSGTVSVATINAAGLATAVATEDDRTITATQGGVVSPIDTLTVTAAALVSIAVSPPSPSIANGSTPTVHGHWHLH